MPLEWSLGPLSCAHSKQKVRRMRVCHLPTLCKWGETCQNGHTCKVAPTQCGSCERKRLGDFCESSETTKEFFFPSSIVWRPKRAIEGRLSGQSTGHPPGLCCAWPVRGCPVRVFNHVCTPIWITPHFGNGWQRLATAENRPSNGRGWGSVGSSTLLRRLVGAYHPTTQPPGDCRT